MRKLIREFVRLSSGCLSLQGPVLEFGAYQVQPSSLADMRPFFSGLDYIGADMRPGPGVDEILDLHSIEKPAEHAGTVLCLETLEHVEYCRLAVEEMHRILKPGGALLLSVPMDFPVHDYPNDFWRFTPEGVRSLLQPFQSCVLQSCGEALHPHSIVAVAWKGPPPPEVEELRTQLQAWANTWKNRAG